MIVDTPSRVERPSLPPIDIQPKPLVMPRRLMLAVAQDASVSQCADYPPPYCPGLQLEEVKPIGVPDGARTFNPKNGIPLPAPAAGDVTLFSFPVPVGYDGIILGQANGYINGGFGQFVEGSGDLVWRIQVNATGAVRYLKDCGEILVSLGQVNLLQTIQGGLRVYSGNQVSMVVAAPNTSGNLPAPGIGQVFGVLHGYFWPR